MENNCCTIFCWFLPYINTNQSYSIRMPPTSWISLPPLTPLIHLGCHRALDLSSLCYTANFHWQSNLTYQFSSVQSLSHVWLFVTPWTAARQASLSITNYRSLLKLISTELVMTSKHLTLCHSPVLLPSIFLSIRVFSNESVLHIRWPKCWSFSFNISPSKEIPGLIFFRMDWLDLLAVQGTLKSLLQHHSSKASILQC